MFKILALDQATVNTGWALISSEGVIEFGLIHADSKLPNEERLREMHSQIKRLIKKVKPSLVVMEAVQYQSNFATFGTLNNLQGVIMAEIFNNNLVFIIVPCSKWRSYCGIRGKRRIELKSNTRMYIADRYGIIASEDEADAIGIATWAIENIREE